MINVKKMKWSFSRLNAFHGCKYAWYLTYVEKQKGIENAFSQYGKFMHKLLEDYAKGEKKAEELIHCYNSQYKKQVPFKFPSNNFCDLAGTHSPR